VKSCVFFAVRTEILHTISASIGFKGLNEIQERHSETRILFSLVYFYVILTIPCKRICFFLLIIELKNKESNNVGRGDMKVTKKISVNIAIFICSLQQISDKEKGNTKIQNLSQ
jgi:hypothetical protein